MVDLTMQKRLVVHIPNELAARLTELARIRMTTASAVTRQALLAALDAAEKKRRELELA